jgi:hypothetical protein
MHQDLHAFLPASQTSLTQSSEIFLDHFFRETFRKYTKHTLYVQCSFFPVSIAVFWIVVQPMSDCDRNVTGIVHYVFT